MCLQSNINFWELHSRSMSVLYSFNMPQSDEGALKNELLTFSIHHISYHLKYPSRNRTHNTNKNDDYSSQITLVICVWDDPFLTISNVAIARFCYHEAWTMHGPWQHEGHFKTKLSYMPINMVQCSTVLTALSQEIEY